MNHFTLRLEPVSKNVTDRDVKHTFAPFGKIKDILINHDADYCLVEYCRESDYRIAMRKMDDQYAFGARAKVTRSNVAPSEERIWKLHRIKIQDLPNEFNQQELVEKITAAAPGIKILRTVVDEADPNACFIDFEDSEHAVQVLEDQSLRSFDGHKLTFSDLGVFETKTDIPNEIVKSLFGERRPRARGGRGRRPRRDRRRRAYGRSRSRSRSRSFSPYDRDRYWGYHPRSPGRRDYDDYEYDRRRPRSRSRHHGRYDESPERGRRHRENSSDTSDRYERRRLRRSDHEDYDRYERRRSPRREDDDYDRYDRRGARSPRREEDDYDRYDRHGHSPRRKGHRASSYDRYERGRSHREESISEDGRYDRHRSRSRRPADSIGDDYDRYERRPRREDSPGDAPDRYDPRASRGPPPPGHEGPIYRRPASASPSRSPRSNVHSSAVAAPVSVASLPVPPRQYERYSASRSPSPRPRPDNPDRDYIR